MLTTIILDGEMGKLFGREHRLNIKSPKQALRLIDINVGGLTEWIKNNATKFGIYRVTCEYLDGSKEALSDETFLAKRGRVKSIRFTPIIQGAGGKGGILQVVVGVVLIVASIYCPALAPYAQYAFSAGMGLAMSGVSAMLAPKPSTGNSSKGESDKTDSYYFSGAENPTDQGQPVPLIYGRIRTGAQAISAAQTVDQLK